MLARVVQLPTERGRVTRNRHWRGGKDRLHSNSPIEGFGRQVIDSLSNNSSDGNAAPLCVESNLPIAFSIEENLHSTIQHEHMLAHVLVPYTETARTTRRCPLPVVPDRPDFHW